MKHNKWMVACLGCLVACAIPGGLGIMWAMLILIACAGGCFAKWLIEEGKYQEAEYKKYLDSLQKRG